MTYDTDTERSKIFRALQRLNWNHGWGDVKEIRRFMDGSIEVRVSSPYRKEQIYIAHTVGRTSVRFRGYQMSYADV